MIRSLAALKEIADERELSASGLPLTGGGSLVPVCRVHQRDQALIGLLAAWRERNMDVYPTQFAVTLEGTATWLRQRVLDVPDRIMFIVTSPDGRPVGHAGVADALSDGASVRVDNVIRGADDAPPGIMRGAVAMLLAWVQRTLAPERIWIKVFSDNEIAIRFFRRLGFTDSGLIPLRRVEHDGRVSFVPVADADANRRHLRLVLGEEVLGSHSRPQVRHP